MTLRLREGKLIFTTAGMHSALLPLTAGAGDATEYVFGYPPWASTPPVHKVTLRMDSDQPEVTISIPGDGDEGLNTYVYTRLAATGATPVP